MYLIFVAIAWLATLTLTTVAWIVTYVLALGELSHLDALAVFFFFAIPYLVAPVVGILLLAHALALQKRPKTPFHFPHFARYSVVLFGSTAVLLLWTGDFTVATLSHPAIILPPLVAWIVYSSWVIALGWMSARGRGHSRV